MSRLYPLKRLPQWMVLTGFVFLLGSVGMAVARFGFEVPLYDRNTGQPASSGGTLMVLLLFGMVGALLMWSGFAILRAAARHRRKQTTTR
jgi:hypothetical protein